MKPFYEESGITIYHGDCREVLPTLETGAAALVLADPPYNVGKRYGRHNDSMPESEYQAWCSTWFRECKRIARRVAVFCGQGNIGVWLPIEKPSGIACWHKPGNPARGSGVFQFGEWEPLLVWGAFPAIGGSDVFRATVNRQADVGDHPCPKPLPLCKRVLERFKAASVLDPFLGSGTTLVAAKWLGIPSIGIEIEERYCEIAAKRLSQGVLPLEMPA